MEIRNGAEALKAFIGVSSPQSAEKAQVRNVGTGASEAAFEGDQVTVSRAGTEISQSAAEGHVRMEKVLAVQKALAAGTYQVPASKVAGKVIDSMLTGGLSVNE